MKEKTGVVITGVSVFLLVASISVGFEFMNLMITVLVGFLAMSIGGLVATRIQGINATYRVIAHGIGSGMMITSATIILAPKAINLDAAFGGAIGGMGIALGYIIGYSSHEIGHTFKHGERISETFYSVKVAEITGHSILSGVLLGVAYGTIPSLSLAFGLGIVAHKFPAGLTTVLADKKMEAAYLILIPASAVGTVSVLSAYLVQGIPSSVHSILFGVSTGLFIHVAIDMTPTCVASDSDHYSSHNQIVCSDDTDKQRVLASLSVLAGAILLFTIWFIGIQGVVF